MTTKNLTISAIVVIVLLGAGFWIYQSSISKPSTDTINKNGVVDPKNATYTIGTREVSLINGKEEQEVVPGSASKTITQYFGNEVKGDFNGDGTVDVAFLLTQNQGGSGTFYYLAVALQTKNGTQGTNAMLLGDRISPQTTEFKDGKILVNYADRKPGEPMTATPSVGVSKYFIITADTLQELVVLP